MDSEFDMAALIRAIAISTGCGLLVAALVRIITHEWKRALILAAAGIVVLTPLIYFLWPHLLEVPRLDLLSRDDAVALLAKKGLVPDVRPQYSDAVEAGRVVPSSQNPPAGLKVNPRTVVSFAVSVRSSASERADTDLARPPAVLAVTLTEPRSSGVVQCLRGADGTYRFAVAGISSGLERSQYRLLLWVSPVDPPADTPGWFLQRPPANGVLRIEPDGAWTGRAQIGNATYPPHDGDQVAVAVTLTRGDAASRLLAGGGVVVQDQPVGDKLDTASHVILRPK